MRRLSSLGGPQRDSEPLPGWSVPEVPRGCPTREGEAKGSGPRSGWGRGPQLVDLLLLQPVQLSATIACHRGSPRDTVAPYCNLRTASTARQSERPSYINSRRCQTSSSRQPQSSVDSCRHGIVKQRRRLIATLHRNTFFVPHPVWTLSLYGSSPISLYGSSSLSFYGSSPLLPIATGRRNAVVTRCRFIRSSSTLLICYFLCTEQLFIIFP